MRHIIHADFDAFYASVEQLDDPTLRGKPVLVGGSPEGRGVVASASYEAREYGIRSAMSMRTALQRCPDAIRVNSNFTRYREISCKVMAIFKELTPLVEPLSLDEAYLDITDSIRPDLGAPEIARDLKKRINRELGLTISVGVATNKSVAKIASDLDKPDGLTVAQPGNEREFLAQLPVGSLWGVGLKTQERLNAEGVDTIGELATQSVEWLRRMFGRKGLEMKRLALGQDDHPVEVGRSVKSVSSETTLHQDTGDTDTLMELVNRLSHNVAGDLNRRDLQGRTIKLKLRLSDFTTFTRQVTLPKPVQSPDQIAAAADRLLITELGRGRLFRLVGVGVAGFSHHQVVDTLQPRIPGL
ncbi:DNA polymerase IV [Dehalococcoidia bacterium]|nr:DNA polymerase IV [Dehalococcoidia bacterium]